MSWLQTSLVVSVRFCGHGLDELWRWLEARNEQGWLEKWDDSSFTHTALPDYLPSSSPSSLLALLSICIFLKTKPNSDAARCAESSSEIWVSLLCCMYIKVLAQVADEGALILFIFSHLAFPMLKSGLLDGKK